MGKQSNFAPRTFLETTCFLSQSLCKVSIDIVCDFFVGNGVFHNHCLVCHHVNTIGKRCEIKILKSSCSNNKDGAHCRKIHKSRREVTRVVFFCGDHYLQSPYDTRKSAFHCLVVHLFFRISLFIHVKWVNNITLLSIRTLHKKNSQFFPKWKGMKVTWFCFGTSCINTFGIVKKWKYI